MESINTKTTSKSDKNKKLIDISFAGLLRGALGLPLQHPFETVKTWMQSQNCTASQSLRSIYEKKGLKGYYSGFGINLVRVISKNAYRWPLIIYLLDLFKDKADKHRLNMGIAGAAAGLTTAVIESIIICPLERLKVWLMTSSSNTSYKSFWRMKNLGSLFDGFWPVILKQTLSWVSFLGTQQYFKQKYYDYIKKNPKEYKLSLPQLTFISTSVCLANTAMVMPADYVKTHFQKFQGDQSQKLRFMEFVRLEYKKNGIKSFYRGGIIKIVHYNIQSVLTVPLLQILFRSYREQ